jgi:uncharacterized protein YijF (DUF1287 family)
MKSACHAYIGETVKYGLCLLLLVAPAAFAGTWEQRLVEAAREQTRHPVAYDGSYERIAYPMGDVAPGRGVCTDVVIRAYRALDVDLQQLVHEDMKANFALYPQNWGLTRPDSNIDHRRVPNLQTYFRRFGESLPVPVAVEDYRPGDLVTWILPGNLPHIGLISTRRSADGKRPLIIHNIGAGPQEEDALDVAPVTGHYRFAPPSQ